MYKFKLFQIEDLGDGIYFIVDCSKVGMYLVVGAERAALIDCGTGIGNLKECIESITNKPVKLLATHGHVDHIGGACNYNEIYINEKDRNLMADGMSIKKRLQFAEFGKDTMCGDSHWTLDDFVTNKEITIMPIYVGDAIDLGGRTLSVINMSGHTRGSVGYFDDRTGTLFSGDGCNDGTLVFSEESTKISHYRRTLQNIKKQLGERYKRHAICHKYSFVPLDCIDNVIECCEIILSGMAENDPFPKMYKALGMNVDSVVWAKAGGGDRLDGKFGNIAYDIRKAE